MTSRMSTTKRIIIAITAAAAVVVVGLALFIGVRVLTGHGLGLGLGLYRIKDVVPAVIHRVKHVPQAVLDRGSVTADNRGDFTNVIFLHHSTGGALIREGGVRELFTAAGFDFWDHNYNRYGLVRPDGSPTGYSYSIPDDNTDPDGLARIFAQRARPLPTNALSGLLQHEVIVFKSCFPASNLTSEAQLQQYKDWYLGMRDVMDAHPDRAFVVMSPPPLHPAATTPEDAARARAFADWLTSPAYLDGHPNVFAFDFFDALAEADPASPEANMLRAAYRPDAVDSHPNQAANEAVGPLFADAVMQAARAYREHIGLTPLTYRDIMVSCPSDTGSHGTIHQGTGDAPAWGARIARPAGFAMALVAVGGVSRATGGAKGRPGRDTRERFSASSRFVPWPSASLNPPAQPLCPQTPSRRPPTRPPDPRLPLTASAPTLATIRAGASRATGASSSPSTSRGPRR